MGVFNVKSSVNLNFGLLKQLDKGSQKALEMTTDALLTEVKNAEVMPFELGTLQNENTYADYSLSSNGVTRIISNTPYARRLYYHPEYNFDRSENAFAGGKWLDPWLKGGTRENFCVEAFEKFYKGVTGI